MPNDEKKNDSSLVDGRIKQTEKYSYKYENILTEVKIERTTDEDGKVNTYATKNLYIEKQEK